MLLTSKPLALGWEGEVTLNKSGDLPFSKQIS
jgi:hypothetical protein